MSDNKRGDYEIGYGRPPVGTRFKKGQRANPNGRPRVDINMWAASSGAPSGCWDPSADGAKLI
ncbi:MAG: hypothetical protein ACK4S3_10370, partial [Parvibaculum sp.]